MPTLNTSTKPANHPHATEDAAIDVLIAGAGPVGLLLACELRLAGMRVRVLEREADPASPFKRAPFGLRGLTLPTVAALRSRGLLDALTRVAGGDRSSTGLKGAHWAQQARKPGGHFAGIQFFIDQIDVATWPYQASDTPQASLAIEMAALETVLAERALELGVQIRRGADVTQVLADDDGVTVHTTDGAASRAAWLVGCDGGRSVVRKAAGFAFAGTEPEFTGYSVEVELDRPGLLKRGRHYTPNGVVTFSEPGIVAMVDFDGGASHRVEPLDAAHVERVLRHVSGVDVHVVALKAATTWTDRALQATQYRRGRVLLAGDAAHVHSPLGGQGLNLGLGDAMNLGWKLAATVRGDAPAGLLDTYEAERQPVGVRVLDWSRAQVALMRPALASRALEAIVRDLMATRDGATYFARRTWGATLRVDVGDGHALAGRIMPDLALADGRHTDALRLRGRGLLLVLGDDATLAHAAAGWHDRVDVVTATASASLGLRAVLVRPDGNVAWASDAEETDSGVVETGVVDSGLAADDAEGLAQALPRWFGAPAARTSAGRA